MGPIIHTLPPPSQPPPPRGSMTVSFHETPQKSERSLKLHFATEIQYKALYTM